MLDVFYRTCEWLENVADSELYTINEFLVKMRELNNGEDATYSVRTVKKKLQEYYENHICFVNFWSINFANNTTWPLKQF